MDKTTANYIEGDVLDVVAKFRKALVVEYAGRNKFELLGHIKANAPEMDHRNRAFISAIRHELAIEALEALLWKERKEAGKEN